MSDTFAHITLPHVNKRALRLGVAGNYGLGEDDLLHAAERGANFWMYNPHWKPITRALRQIVAPQPERHVVAVLGMASYSGGMLRRLTEKSLRSLGIDQLDLLLLPWLGRASLFTQGIRDTLVRLKEEGRVRAVGTSIHDRKRAGELARESILDALMIRYNAKHPGAEQDIFPHVEARHPLIIAYTATSWRQLLRPVSGIDMPPWTGAPGATPPPPLSPAHCYRFCLTSPHVHLVWTAPKTQEQLNENLAALEQGPLPEQEYAWVREYGRKLKAKRRLPYL
jgi:aryl-alcohol dehydrogenase-like predicted oxidoreductase